MDGYTLLERIGAGSYSTVWRAREHATGRSVAIKELTSGFDWAAVQAMPEVLASRVLPSHEGILRLHAVHRVGGRVFLVMDHCACSLLDALQKRSTVGGAAGPGMSEPEVRFILRRMLSALAQVAAAGYVHRDVKPENILLAAVSGSGSGAGSGVVRPLLADFGQIRRLTTTSRDGSDSSATTKLTPYVSTRWYRAPEVLLRVGTYDAKIDVWAAGCTLLELLTGRPAFAGSSEADQFYRLCVALGPPDARSWSKGAEAAARIGFTIPPVTTAGITALLPARASAEVRTAVAAMLEWDPARRPSASAALSQLAFFASHQIESSPALPPPVARPAEEAAARRDASIRQTQLDAEIIAISNINDSASAAASAEVGRGGGGKEDSSDETLPHTQRQPRNTIVPAFITTSAISRNNNSDSDDDDDDVSLSKPILLMQQQRTGSVNSLLAAPMSGRLSGRSMLPGGGCLNPFGTTTTTTTAMTDNTTITPTPAAAIAHIRRTPGEGKEADDSSSSDSSVEEKDTKRVMTLASPPFSPRSPSKEADSDNDEVPSAYLPSF